MQGISIEIQLDSVTYTVFSSEFLSDKSATKLTLPKSKSISVFGPENLLL